MDKLKGGSEPPKNGWDLGDLSPEDRIQARRQRIENRIKTAQRMHKLIKAQHVFGNKAPDGAQSFIPVKTQCENSKIIIEDLIENGSELVSNVRLASEHLNVLHNQGHEERLKALRSIISKEDEDAKVFCEAIQSKWKSSESIPDGAPTELYHKIMEQNKACNELLGKRNDLIELLDIEIQGSDDQYRMLISEFHENIEVLTSRMEGQVQNLEKVITREWGTMERVLEAQREAQLKKKDIGVSHKLDKLNRVAEEKLQARLGILDRQQNEIDAMIHDDADVYKELKMETEEALAGLTDQIHMMDAVHQLNEEKLDYEIHVLRKHEEENVHVKSEQKRRIASLQDSLNTIKLKISDRKMKLKSEEDSLIHGIAQSQSTLKKLKGKKQTLLRQSQSKKEEIFKIAADTLFNDLERISDMEHLLAKLYGPTERPSRVQIKPNTTLNGPHLSSGSDSYTSENSSSISGGGGEILQLFHTELKDEAFKSMLSNMVQEVHFLVEENLGYLIDTIPEDERNLFKLDSILNVLGVECEEEILGVLRQANEKSSSLSATYSDLLKILRNYVDEHHKESAMGEKTSNNKTIISGKRNKGFIQRNNDFHEDIEAIREAMGSLRSSQTLTLKTSLIEYLNILKERSAAAKENEKLSKVNSELKSILKKAGI